MKPVTLSLIAASIYYATQVYDGVTRCGWEIPAAVWLLAGTICLCTACIVTAIERIRP